MVVQRLDSAIHRINHYPVYSAISFPNTYPLDSDFPVDSTIQRLNNRGLAIYIHGQGFELGTTMNNSSERSEWVELKALKLQFQRFNRLATLPPLNFLLIQQLTSFSNCSFSCIKFATFCSKSPHCCLKVCSSTTFCFNLHSKNRMVYKYYCT